MALYTCVVVALHGCAAECFFSINTAHHTHRVLDVHVCHTLS